MPEIIEFTLPLSDRSDPQLVFNDRSGGMGMDGTEQILSPLSERWQMSISVPIRSEVEARALRVIKAGLKGRFNYLRLRICDQFRVSRRDVGGWSAVTGVPFGDGAWFSDGSGFALPQPNSPVMADAAANTDVVTVRASDFGGYMSAGLFFSINDFLYQVDSWELDGSNYLLTVSPPLRQAITTDDEANFDATCLWRLEESDGGAVSLRGGRVGVAVLNLVEPVGR